MDLFARFRINGQYIFVKWWRADLYGTVFEDLDNSLGIDLRKTTMLEF